MNENGHHPGDARIRPALIGWLRRRHPRTSNPVLVQELGLCKGAVRVDVLVVTNSIEGYEIKSDQDTLFRLKNQVEVYSKVLDRASIVVGPKHAAHINEHIPEWWGLLTATPGPRAQTIERIRKARRNPNVDPRSLVQLLWRDEALAFLQERSAARGVRTKNRDAVWDRVCQSYTTPEIAARVRQCLRSRDLPGFSPLHSQPTAKPAPEVDQETGTCQSSART